MDSVSLISTVMSAREGAQANERQIAVAANAARSQEQAVAVLLQAIQSSAYNAGGHMSTPAVSVGTNFSGVG
jgi:hypothetical protein